MSGPEPTEAAGAVVWREAADGVEVVVIHRPKYDDWSLPKGKVDSGEHVLSAAVREVGEETGLRVRLGPALAGHTYSVGRERKRVRYWSAQRMDGTDAFVPNDEVDEVTWLPAAEARDRLSYPRDADVLDTLTASWPTMHSQPLLVLRHAHALSRDTWRGEDGDRPLTESGALQARALIPLLRAYGVRRVVSSDAVRCTATVQPYAAQASLDVEVDRRLSEEGIDPDGVAEHVRALWQTTTGSVLCSHRKVLPTIFATVGVDDPALAPGALVVVHHRAGRIRATEQHVL